MKKPIVFTCGDPSGVGPEIIQRYLEENKGDEFAVIGPASWLETLALEENQKIIVGEKDYCLTPGIPDESGAILAFEALEIAAKGCLEGRFSAVVTAPVSKAQLKKVGYLFSGQTEFFADYWEGVPSMGFVGEHLKLVLATWHIPLMTVGESLKKYPELIIRAVERAAMMLKFYGVEEPRIAVCGLNPHAGEEGILGTEEKEWLNPLLDELRLTYPGLSCALPSDTVFYRMLQGDFDVAVALYHDQGLGPLKTLEFDSAVNVTLGLPFVRTSPDHGTAFDIAGKGIASTQSFARAVGVARRLITS